MSVQPAVCGAAGSQLCHCNENDSGTELAHAPTSALNGCARSTVAGIAGAVTFVGGPSGAVEALVEATLVADPGATRTPATSRLLFDAEDLLCASE
jgi:hypothetical protein